MSSTVKPNIINKLDPLSFIGEITMLALEHFIEGEEKKSLEKNDPDILKRAHLDLTKLESYCKDKSAYIREQLKKMGAL